MIKDIEIAYPGWRELGARARLRVYEEYSRRRRGQTARLVVVYSEPEGEYTGLSPTNGAERIATIAATKLGNVALNRVVFVDYSPPTCVRDEMFDFVWFRWIKGKPDWWIAALGAPPGILATRAFWRPSSRQEIEALIGEVFK